LIIVISVAAVPIDNTTSLVVIPAIYVHALPILPADLKVLTSVYGTRGVLHCCGYRSNGVIATERLKSPRLAPTAVALHNVYTPCIQALTATSVDDLGSALSPGEFPCLIIPTSTRRLNDRIRTARFETHLSVMVDDVTESSTRVWNDNCHSVAGLCRRPPSVKFKFKTLAGSRWFADPASETTLPIIGTGDNPLTTPILEHAEDFDVSSRR
jgi:hypothetical protein